MKLLDLMVSALLFLKQILVLNVVVVLNVRYYIKKYVTLKMRVAIKFSLQLGNHKPKHTNFDIVFKASDCT